MHIARAASLLLGLVFASCSASTPAFAQFYRVAQPHPDCNLLERRIDSFTDGRSLSFIQRRIYWHIETALGSFLLAEGVTKLLPRIPKRATAISTALGIGVLPHVRSVFIERRYPINPLDIAFDATNAATPLLAVGDHRERAAVTWLIADAALSCWASP